jgi:hypothetical protein
MGNGRQCSGSWCETLELSRTRQRVKHRFDSP